MKEDRTDRPPPTDPGETRELMDRELERIRTLEARPFLPRTLGYLRLIGPGYMQSAMTLGGGTAFASIFAGAAFGYELLWVAPIAMLLGIIVLSAVAHQTLSNPQNPFEAMKEHAGPFFAYGWAIGGILSSIIWQFAQYALASSMLVAIAKRSGFDLPNWSMGLATLAWCVSVALLYDSKPRFVRLYEKIIKGMVWFIIACFGFVVIKTGIPHPEDLLQGLIPFRIPGESHGIRGSTLVVSGLAAAVGANMVFVYPYTLRKRHWKREHRRLARIDLGFGMFLPYAIAASLMLIASASVFHYGDPDLFVGKKIAPWQAAEMLAAPDRLGPLVGMWVFGLGIVAMALSSITMQMLCSGFALCELLGKKSEGPTYKIGLLLPAIGVLGAVFWKDISLWLAVPTNVVCGFLLPVAYIGFIKLQRSRAYLGPDRPTGFRGGLWTLGMWTSTLVLVGFLSWFAYARIPGWIQSL